VYGSVLGSRSRAERNQALEALLAWGLSRYRPVVAIDAHRTYAEARTGYGRPPVALVAPHARVRPVRAGVALVEHVVAPVSVALPVRRGQPLGRIEVYDGRRLVAFERLVAAADVSEPGLVGKAGWYARRVAANLWGIVS